MKITPYFRNEFPDGFLIVVNSVNEYSEYFKDIPKLPVDAIVNGFNMVGLKSKCYKRVGLVVEGQSYEYIREVLINMR